MKRWQDWASLALGAWTLASPWALGFASDQNTAAWSAWSLGAAILVFSGIAVAMPKAWEEVINILLGVALIVSPWALSFATQSTPTSNAVIVGVLVVALGVWAMLMDATVRERLLHRHESR